MEIEKIKEVVNALLEVIRGTDVEEIEVEDSGMRVRVKRRSRTKRAVTATTPETAPAEKQAEGEIEEWEGYHIVRSPFVGTFYRAPSPGAPPFVEVGDEVKKGQVLCIVEAMKIMNEVEADVDGKIVHIFVKNGDPVEYGQPLFAIDTGE